MAIPVDNIIDYIMPAGNSGNGSAQNQSRIATPKTQEEFNALPNGTYYIEPDDGHIYQKGNKRHPIYHEPRGTLA